MTPLTDALDQLITQLDAALQPAPKPPTTATNTAGDLPTGATQQPPDVGSPPLPQPTVGDEPSVAPSLRGSVASSPNLFPDAIDRALAETPRTTRVPSLADHDVVRRFRQELTDGRIRIDTVNQLLRLIQAGLTLIPR